MGSANNTVTKSTRKSSVKTSLKLRRVFTKSDVHPYDELKWGKRDAKVGKFEQNGVEFPETWSNNAVNITSSKYFRGKLTSPDRETSLKQTIDRVVKTIRSWGEDFGYFDSPSQAKIFEDELTHIVVNQKASFNSPVWFNVGTMDKPQCSACFILSVKDDMRSILEWISTEGMIFKGGSGSGINISTLRSKTENLSGGGYASGPVSFMRGADSVAGMIKSGGTTRRAAKMVVLDVDHPDIMDFVRCKAEDEKKIRAFMSAGYDMSDLNNDAWNSVQFQNANNSVRVSDEFMEAVEADGEWATKLRVGGKNGPTYKARELLKEIAQAAWGSGDPGIQFDTIINKWHTCPNSGRINASNPCSEYMHLDDSACNLASINLMKFLREDGTFMVKEFLHTVRMLILAQDIIVDGSGYPTEKIGENAHNFRELGLGFANLGAFLMTKGFPYDSDEARAWAASIASLMCGEAYRFSAEIASKVGPFNGYKVNKEPMLGVIQMHLDESRKIDDSFVEDSLLVKEARAVWDGALDLGKKFGYRNSQVTVIAPTGTIAFMMDCDTTGIEPDFSLVKMKSLVGGGWMKIVNMAVEGALANLGYESEEVGDMINWIVEHGTIEGAPHAKEDHFAVFDTAVKSPDGTRSISWQGHVKMVAAVQPFISGAISKTFNMSNETTREEIEEAYMMAWKLGIKAFAVYRDGSKATQPLSSAGSNSDTSSASTSVTVPRVGVAIKRHLPATRPSETHKFTIAGHKGYITYSMFEDGALSEVFIRMAKQGSTLAGLLDSFAVSISIALQYGVPLETLADKFVRTRFEPAGYTGNPDIMVATSILDYIFRYLAMNFLDEEALVNLGIMRANFEETEEEVVESIVSSEADEVVKIEQSVVAVARAEYGNGNHVKYVSAGTVCKRCGGMMVQSGSCYTCLECGTSSGGCS